MSVKKNLECTCISNYPNLQKHFVIIRKCKFWDLFERKVIVSNACNSDFISSVQNVQRMFVLTT